MKKRKLFLKIAVIIILLNFLTLCCFSVDATITPKDLNKQVRNTTQMKPILSSVLNLTSIIASAISIIVLICLGIKYMVGSVEQKATYKKTLLPYVIGASFVFGASTIASVIYNMF